MIKILFIPFLSFCINASVYEWTAINVNSISKQGDANLLELDGRFVLIDVGKDFYNKEVISFVKSKTDRIHDLYISHQHKDHYGGMAAISDQIQIDRIHIHPFPDANNDCCYDKQHWENALQHVIENGAQLIIEKQGEVYHYGNAKLKIEHLSKRSDVGANDYSIIQSLKVYDTSVLFTGDLNHKVGLELSSSIGKFDIMKTPHHGWTGIAPIQFFNAVSANVLITEGLSFFPNDERWHVTGEYLDSSGAENYLSGRDGNISVSFYNGGYSVNGKLYENKNIEMAPIISYLIN